MDNLRPVELDSPLNRRVRVFLGIGPAPAEWAEPLNLWVTQLGRRIKGWRWVPEANLHLTLRFFGHVTQAEVLKITEIFADISGRQSGFTMEMVDLVLFPRVERPRVAGIEFRDQSGELLELEKAIRGRTSNIGEPPEKRDFTPHVTFGRATENDHQSQILMCDLWRKKMGPTLPDWKVNEVKLFRSELQPGGSVYTPLATFPLR